MKNNIFKYYALLFSTLLFGGIAAYWYIYGQREINDSLSASAIDVARPGEDEPSSPQSNSTPSLPPAPENRTTVVYTDSAVGYSLELPAGFEPEIYDEEGGSRVVVMQETKNRRAFQIFSIPFDEEGPLTFERIKKDIPDLMIERPHQVVIGKKNITALAFESISEFGKTKELWFVDTQTLFQISAPLDFDKALAEIMKTWRFL